MKQLKIAAMLPLVFGISIWGLSPSPEQVQQAKEAVKAGQVQVTPDLIDQAKSQYPDLKSIPDEKIQKKADGLTKEGAEKNKSPGSSPDASQQKPTQPETPLVSRGAGGVVANDQSGPAPRFPAGLRRFGSDFFRNVDLDGMGANVPALPDYQLSPGDEIQIYTWGRDSRNAAVVIDNEGMLSYPPLSPLRVAGMKFATAQKLITSEIEKIQGVTASVGLGKLRSIRVMVLGEAASPGSYTLPAGTTVTSALFRSGGISGIGSLRNVQVRRDDRIIATLDLYDMLLKGARRSDIQLLPGDVVFVPLSSTQIAVDGMVKRPGIYEVKPGTKTLEALELAGGLVSDAYQGRVRLDRVQSHKRNVVLDVDMEKKPAASNVVLEDGDILFVDKVLDRVDDVVYLEGNVNRPGRYQYKNGMTVKDLIPSAKDLKPETFLEYAHIKRPDPEDDRPTLLNFSLKDVLSKGLEVPLQPRDIVVIYNRYNVIEHPSVKVFGAVRHAGEFPYRDAMRISDLVILADGLGDAYLPEAQLVRLVHQADRDTVFTQLIRVNLKNIVENPLSKENLELRPFDALNVFPRSAFMPSGLVSISGAVRGGGSFGLSDQMRISDLIKMAGGLGEDAYLWEAHLRRRIYLADRDSAFTQLIRINLKSIRDNPESEDNLALIPYDALSVLPRSAFVYGKSVNIFGTVRKEGEYELVDQMGIPELIKMAGGLTKDSYILDIEVSRRKLEHDSVVTREVTKISLKDILTRKVSFELRDGDGVYVREVVNAHKYTSITLNGEFSFPGRYEFTPGERLSSVIRRAHGFTPEAYVRGTVFIRQSVKAQQIQSAREIERHSAKELESTLQQTAEAKEKFVIQAEIDRQKKLVYEIENAPNLGRVVIQLDKEMKFARTDWDVALEDGDMISVGTQLNTISIDGEVYSPTTVFYTEKTNTIGECLATAGGVNSFGDYSNTYYLAPDGSILTPRTTPWYRSYSGMTVESGGSIIVPTKPPPPPPDENVLSNLLKTSQILFNLAVAVGVIKALY